MDCSARLAVVAAFPKKADCHKHAFRVLKCAFATTCTHRGCAESLCNLASPLWVGSLRRACPSVLCKLCKSGAGLHCQSVWVLPGVWAICAPPQLLDGGCVSGKHIGCSNGAFPRVAVRLWLGDFRSLQLKNRRPQLSRNVGTRGLKQEDCWGLDEAWGELRGAEKATCRWLKNLSCSQFILIRCLFIVCSRKVT